MLGSLKKKVEIKAEIRSRRQKYEKTRSNFYFEIKIKKFIGNSQFF